VRWLTLSLLVACASPTGSVGQELSGQARTDRLTTIRDIAAQMGLYNGPLLGGIAVSETGLAHCQSEAPSACPGPASSSCAGGPVIAGAADGPCSAMQGGLGLFQFDAGTYAQTVATYGDDVLTVEGNTAQAVSFVVGKVDLDIAGATDWLSATAWMNQVPLVAGDPTMEQWSHLLACRYNGCCATSATCTTRANTYRDNAIALAGELGSDFWATAGRCAAIPEGGVIDQRSDCYLAAGDPRYWRHEAVGYGGSLEWTMTTSATAKANFAQWLIRTHRAGRFHLEVSLDGGTFGQSKQAAYIVSHAGQTDTVMIDQTSATGFVALGDFDFAGDASENVLLADNTGEAAATQTKLLFDALRVTPLDGGALVDAGADETPHKGGCAVAERGTWYGAGGAGGLAVVVLALLLRRRR
jgi:hypothetical protein